MLFYHPSSVTIRSGTHSKASLIAIFPYQLGHTRKLGEGARDSLLCHLLLYTRHAIDQRRPPPNHSTKTAMDTYQEKKVHVAPELNGDKMGEVPDTEQGTYEQGVQKFNRLG